MSEWKTYKLRDVVNILDYKRIPLSSRQREQRRGKYPYYGAQGIIDYIDDYIFDGIYLLVAEDGENLRSKKQHIAQLVSGKYWVNNHAHILESNGLCDIRYICYLLNVFDISGYITGSAQPKLNQANLLAIEITLPPLAEQKRIADILSAIDDKIELNRRINANLEQQAQALFDEIMSCELEYDLIANIPHVIETGKRPKGGVASITSGIPSIGAENIKGLGYYDYSKTKYITEEFATTLKKGFVNGYELLIYKDGGKPGYFIPNFSIFGNGFPYNKMALNEHVFLLDFRNKGYNFFAYFYFQQEKIMRYLNAQGSKAAIPGINRNDIENISIPTIQNKVIQDFCRQIENIITHILNNASESRKLSIVRDTLLPKLMSGEIKV